MIRTLSILGILSCCMPAAASAGDVRVQITGAASGSGNVRAALFSSAKAFADDAPLTGVFIQADDAVEIVFANVPPGRYAISSFFDANGNAELDRNLVGIPSERFGFSRNARGNFGPPGFEDIAFDVDTEGISLSIELR